jgi:hypothetical protein
VNWKVFTAVLLIPAFAAAQVPPIETTPPGDDKITTVKKDAVVPYDGQLFDPSTALRWANWLRQYKVRLHEDVLREQKVCKVKIDYEQKLVKIEKDRSKTVTTDLRARLVRSEKARLDAEDEARNPPWYRSIWLGLGAGVVGTLATAFIVVKATDSSK